MSKKPIALQLYTLREAAEKDFLGTLKAVAEIGFKGVEFAGLYGNAPKDIAKYIADLGMVACSTHSGVPDKDTLAETLDMAGTLGCPHDVVNHLLDRHLNRRRRY